MYLLVSLRWDLIKVTLVSLGSDTVATSLLWSSCWFQNSGVPWVKLETVHGGQHMRFLLGDQCVDLCTLPEP